MAQHLVVYLHPDDWPAIVRRFAGAHHVVYRLSNAFRKGQAIVRPKAEDFGVQRKALP